MPGEQLHFTTGEQLQFTTGETMNFFKKMIGVMEGCMGGMMSGQTTVLCMAL
jgi:hypothetical protein